LRDDSAITVDSDTLRDLPPLPSDINFSVDGENLLPTNVGQVIQVSKVHADGLFCYGTTLFDPLLDDAKQTSNTTAPALNAVLANALHDRPSSGWFPKNATEPADATVMKGLLERLGGAGAEVLEPPSCWDKNASGTSCLEGIFPVPTNTPEYKEVTDYFLTRLYQQAGSVKVTSLKRI